MSDIRRQKFSRFQMFIRFQISDKDIISLRLKWLIINVELRTENHREKQKT